MYLLTRINGRQILQKDTRSFYFLLPFLAALLISTLMVDNPLMVLPIPFGVNYAVVIIVLLFCLAISFVAIVLYRKKSGQSSMRILPLTVFFCLPPIYFSLQFLLLGGYEERVFQYFGVMYPLIALLVLSQFNKETLAKFLRAYAQSFLVILCTLTLISVVYAHYYLFTQVTELQDLGDNRDASALTQYEIKQKSDQYFNALSHEGIALSNEVDRSDEGDKVQGLINTIKNYEIKDYYQIPLGGSNYIGSILLTFIALSVLIPHKHKRFNLFYLLLGGLCIFIIQSSGSIISFIFLLLLMVFLERESLDGWFYQKTKRSSLNYLRQHKTGIKRFVLVSAISALAILVVYTLSQYAIGHTLDKSIFDALFTGRVSIYQDTIMYWTHQPLLGFGFQYDAFMHKPHNLFLSLLAYGGIFGLIVFVVLLASILHYAIKHKTVYSNAIIAMMLVALVHGLIEPNFLNSMFDLYFWSAMATLIVLHTYECTQSEDLQAVNIETIKKRLVQRKSYAYSALGLALCACALSVAGVLTHNYLTQATINVTGIVEENSPAPLPKEKSVQAEIYETAEKITASNIMHNPKALLEMGQVAQLQFDSNYPKDVFSAYYDYEKQELTLRIISHLSERDKRIEQAQSIQSYVIDYQEKLSPFLEFEAGDITTLETQSLKTQAMKVLLSIVFVCVFCLYAALTNRLFKHK